MDQYAGWWREGQRSRGWCAVVSAAPGGGYEGVLTLDSGEQLKWPRGVVADDQGVVKFRSWVRRSLERALRFGTLQPDRKLPTGTIAPARGAPAAWAERETVGSSDAAQLFNVNRSRIAMWAREGRLPHTRTIGGHNRFPLVELEALAGVRLREVLGFGSSPTASADRPARP